MTKYVSQYLIVATILIIRNSQFPSYLKDNASTLSSEDQTRYQAQYKVVAQIVETFEDPSYNDDDPQKGLKVVELMQEVRRTFLPAIRLI